MHIQETHQDLKQFRFIYQMFQIAISKLSENDIPAIFTNSNNQRQEYQIYVVKMYHHCMAKTEIDML